MADWDDQSNSSRGKKLFSRFRGSSHRSQSGVSNVAGPDKLGGSDRHAHSSSLGGIDEDYDELAATSSPLMNSKQYHRGSAPANLMEDAAQQHLMMQYRYQQQMTAAQRSQSSRDSRHDGSDAGNNTEKRSKSKSTSSSNPSNVSRVTSEEEPTDEDRKDRHRSKSRHRDKSRSKHRSRSRHRSKSRDAVERMGDEMQQLQSQSQQVHQQNQAIEVESLRDYWKRRAEESKEKAAEESASAAASSPPASYIKRDGRDRELDKQLERHRARSKSRGRVLSSNYATNALASSTTDATTFNATGEARKKNVDSIASALLPHQVKMDRHTDEIPPLHAALEKSDWNLLNTTLMTLAKAGNTSDTAAQLSVPHPIEGGTALHVAAWKAPPALCVKMIRLLPRDAREISVLMGIRDGQGNTPLHLCCGNLEYREGGGDYCLAALKEIVKVAPAKAWSMQNFEGDTPLHLLVTSQLCSADVASSFTGSTNNSASQLLSSAATASKLALEAVDLALFCGTESLTVRERTGATPLHVALAHGAHACVVEALLDAAPAAAMIEDARGMLPLHWAAAFGRASVSVVKRLIDEHPQALVHPTIDGDIPLHLIVANSMIEDEDGKRRDSSGVGGTAGGVDNKVDKNRLKMVELLLQDPGRAVTSRDGVMMTPILTTNREKLTPLHCCALFDAPPQISKLLMKHPDANAASAMTNSFGATPLHLAAAQPGVSQSIATVLAIGTPDAATVQDRLKRTPLHVAAQNTYATNLLIKTLAELNPGAAAVKTQRGHLPLHLAAQSQAKEPVIRALIKAYPAAAEARNKSNNTPLHDAAKYRASLGVVKLLLDAYPGALYVQNQYGNLPLHCATAYQAPSEVVQLLLESWPEGASMQNRNQDAPLHYAAAYATSAAAVRPLIEAAPAAVLSMNSSGQSPIDRAKANNAPSDIIELLENAAEEYSRHADGWASFGQQR